MAAGLGFKDFTTGEVLTAADVDGYLMQGVWVFASAAARDAAVTSPQEGNFAYLKDTNVTTYYTGSAWANLDTTGMTNPMTTTGDIIYSSPGSTPVRLGIGTANQVLRVNSGATAPEWATPASGSSFVGCTVKRVNTSTALTGGVNYIIAFTSEEYDTDGFHDNSTNNTRITIPAGKAGKYLLTGSINTPNNNPGNYQYFQLLKNGSDYTASGIRGAQVVRRASGGENALLAFSQIVDAAVSDYFEIQYQQQLSFTDDIWANFQAAYLGA